MINIDKQPKTVAELMNPQDEQNDLDLSGLGVDWRPEEILAAAEIQLPSVVNSTETGEKNENKKWSLYKTKKKSVFYRSWCRRESGRY